MADCEQTDHTHTPCHLLFELGTPVTAVVRDSGNVPSPTINNSLSFILKAHCSEPEPELLIFRANVGDGVVLKSTIVSNVSSNH